MAQANTISHVGCSSAVKNFTQTAPKAGGERLASCLYLAQVEKIRYKIVFVYYKIA
jgi:hypothetical protein